MTSRRSTARRAHCAAALLCAFGATLTAATAEEMAVSGSPNHRILTPAIAEPMIVGDGNHRRFVASAAAPAVGKGPAADFEATGSPNHRRIIRTVARN